MNKLKKFAPFVLIPVLLILLLAGKDRSLPILKGSLSGRVINIQGEGLAKAKLLLKSRGFQKEILTDGQGAFEVPALPTGVYEITTKPSGSGRPVTQEVAIHLGGESFVTLVTREKGLEEEELSNQIPAPRYVLDDQGRVVSQETQVEDKFYYMEYSYDPYGRLKTATDNLNERWDYEYTDSGKIGEVRRTDGQSLLFNYDKDDNLRKVDLPWGYKIFYRKDENKFTKTVKKYKNLTLFEFSYTLDEKGNKIKVEEGAGLMKQKFQHIYDNNDRLLEIRHLNSGERNTSVFKRKGKILDASVFGQILLKDGKYQDRFYEYGFDERGNITYQKSKSSPVEVVREFNKRNLLVRETYLFQSSPVLSIEYKYDIFDRLALKSISNGISFYYLRDKDGQVTHKIMKNMLTGEESDGVSYTPYLSEVDQDGFELIKYEGREKLFVKDAEGNRRYMVEIFDVLRYNTHYHQRNVHTDGDFSREIEYVMSQILERIQNPRSSVFDLLREFFDLPLENPVESGEGMVQVQSAVPGEVGCYYYGWCAPQYSYCVDCGPGAGGGDEPGPGDSGGAPECTANISGFTLVMVNEHVTYNLSTDCFEPTGFNWGGGEGGNSGTTSYTTWWTSSGDYIVTVSFSATGEESYEDPPGSGNWKVNVISKTATLDVDVFDEDEPPIIPPSGNDNTELTIMIYYVQTPSGGGSFIADRLRTGDLIIVYGKATYGTLDVSNQITWTCTDNLNDSTVSGTTEAPWGTRGSVCSFIPIPPREITGRTAPLSYLIKAQITAGGKTREDSATVTQDNLDELRQEYEDLWRISQARSNFDQDPAAFDGLLGVGAEPNRHRWHILRSLNQHARDADYYYIADYFGGGINFTSGYRCPVGNLRVGGEANSNHQYGKAFDFDQGSNTQANSWNNYYVYLAVTEGAVAGADTYLLKSDKNKVFWYQYVPPPNQVTYIQGHAAWDN
jgi:YD repeat-containing protein